jgi:hypothetical protein
MRGRRRQANRVMTACADAATPLSTSCSGGQGSGGPASPPTKPNWRTASWRIASAAERSRRSQPRTVAAGTPSPAPIRPQPAPASPISAAVPMTSIASARPGAHHGSSRTWVRLHEPQRASRAVAPPSRRTARSRPYPTASSAARRRRTGRPASLPPGPRTQRRHQRTAGQKAFQVTTTTMPAWGTCPPGAARVQPGRL